MAKLIGAGMPNSLPIIGAFKQRYEIRRRMIGETLKFKENL
jgi:hypothetical protein